MAEPLDLEEARRRAAKAIRDVLYPGESGVRAVCQTAAKVALDGVDLSSVLARLRDIADALATTQDERDEARVRAEKAEGERDAARASARVFMGLAARWVVHTRNIDPSKDQLTYDRGLKLFRESEPSELGVEATEAALLDKLGEPS